MQVKNRLIPIFVLTCNGSPVKVKLSYKMNSLYLAIYNAIREPELHGIKREMKGEQRENVKKVILQTHG